MTKKDNETSDWELERESQLEARRLLLKERGLLESVPTDVAFVRFISPDEEPRVYSQVLRERGFDWMAIQSDDASQWELPDEQKEAAAEALFRCYAMYPVHPGYYLPLAERQIRVLYDYYVETLAPCLRERGYDPGPIPSWEYFAAHYGKQSEWSPYALIEERHLDASQLNIEECPRNPPIDRLFASA